jgi:hypothetical protein
VHSFSPYDVDPDVSDGSDLGGRQDQRDEDGYANAADDRNAIR